jgi:hypothetical protein
MVFLSLGGRGVILMKMILRHAFYQIPRKNINKASSKTAAAHE